MKILLSAYACEPNRGSEPAVGWNWVNHLALQGHQLWVLTRNNNRKCIESALPLPNVQHQPNFIYFDLPIWLSWWKRGVKGVYFYYFFWQIGLFFSAQQLCQKISFDYIHHVTFVNVRQPSFLGYLGVPFIFGPVSGGDRAPFSLRKSFPWQGWLKDFLRDVLNTLVQFDPLMHITFHSAQKIYVNSEATKNIVPSSYHFKSHVQLAIGTNTLLSTSISPPKKQETNDHFKILYAGNLLYLKGLHLALHAFYQFRLRHSNSHFTIIGSGSDKHWLQAMAIKLNISDVIEWVDPLPQDELQSQYPLYDVFLFPSLHDSGGLVILEAMRQACPVVTLDIGGPGIIVNNNCGRVITTQNHTEAKVISELAEALYILAKNPNLRKQTGISARKRVADFEWNQLVRNIYG